jgi:hypothetical protein
VRHFVLAAGVNYDKLQLNDSFKHCLRPRTEWLVSRHHKQDDLTFTLFDFTRGLTTQLLVPRKGPRKERPLDPRFKRVTADSYDQLPTRVRFKDFQPDVMSIVDIYDFIEELGASDQARSLFELSIFSHAFAEGPICVNSDDDRQRKNADGSYTRLVNNERDPDDKDARVIDFLPTNRRLPEFQQAFNPDAMIRMWGCLHTLPVVALFKAIFASRDYKSKGLKDDQILTIPLRTELKTALSESRIKDFVKDAGLVIPFGRLRRVFYGELTSCYNDLIARMAKIPTYGGVPGTGSDFNHNNGAAPMVIVQKGSHNTQTLDFYRNYLNVTLEASTNYALFTPTPRPFPK